MEYFSSAKILKLCLTFERKHPTFGRVLYVEIAVINVETIILRQGAEQVRWLQVFYVLLGGVQ